MMGRVMAALVLVAVVVAGCGGGRLTTAPARRAAVQSEGAKERALAFYRAHFLGQDYGAAWDMALPGTLAEYQSKAEYVARRERLLGKVAGGDTAPLHFTEYQRDGDYLYLVGDQYREVLIWVTLTADGWRVRRYANYEGGPVEW